MFFEVQDQILPVQGWGQAIWGPGWDRWGLSDLLTVQVSLPFPTPCSLLLPAPPPSAQDPHKVQAPPAG